MRPLNLLHASRIEGVTPAAMTLITLPKKKSVSDKKKKKQLNYDVLLNKIGVSRGTCDLLCVYYDMLKFWNKKINLVSRKSIEHLGKDIF